MSALCLQETFDKLDTILFGEEETPEVITVSRGLLAAAWRLLGEQIDLQSTMTNMIDSLKSMDPTADSHAGGVVTGYIEVNDMLVNGVDDET